MKKQLITASNLHDFCEGNILQLKPEYILSPSALDHARNLGIPVKKGVDKAESRPTKSQSTPLDPEQAGHEFIMPGQSLLGYGCLERGIARLKTMKCRKVLLVTDAGLNKSGIADTVREKLTGYKIEAIIYDGTEPNPTCANVTEGLNLLKKHSCDAVVSLGGGSPHDCAKAIALLATNGGHISDYEGVNRSEKAGLPLIAINTTAGTASEMTRFCIITNKQTHIKMAIVDQHVTPLMAVNDPQLMLGMPARLTAATGLDALTHAIEAYLSINATPLTDAVASKAIELIIANLPLAVEDGSNIQARESMAYAQFMAGMAFNSAGLGYVHAMAHQLGGKYNLPHGICNAVLLPHVMTYNLEISSQKLSDIAYFLNCKVNGKTNREASIMGIKAICRLLLEVSIPTNLAELGVKFEDIPEMANNALKDTCALTNPRQGCQKDIEQIFISAM